MSQSETETETESRWFVLPLVGTRAFDNSPGIEWGAKYADREGIRGEAGNDYHFPAETFPGLPWAGEGMFVGRLFGTPDALDAVAAQSDAFGMAEFGLSGDDIAGYLNDRLGRDRSFEEWAESFGVSE